MEQCQYEHGCPRMAADNGWGLCWFHYQLETSTADTEEDE